MRKFGSCWFVEVIPVKKSNNGWSIQGTDHTSADDISALSTEEEANSRLAGLGQIIIIIIIIISGSRNSK